MTNELVISLALDVGSARVGLAIARSDTRLPSPLPALNNDESFWSNLQAVIAQQQVGQLVVGWPRGLDGQQTAQTDYVAQFITALQQQIALPVSKQDEALTSKKAEAELMARGKAYTKGDIDSLSATYILEDFLQEGMR